MKPAQLVSAGSVERMLKTAEEAWKRKDFEQSIELLERASRLAPANVSVLLQLGRVHGLRCDYAAAERCFEKAVRVAPKKTETLLAAGEQCRDFRDRELEERYLKRAAEQPDAAPEMFVQLAAFYERDRRIDEASALVERALRLDGACGSALLARARLERLAGRLEPAENSVRALLNQPDPGPQPGRERDTRIRGWYELGAILDRQKRFDEAMAAFLQAKSMLRLFAGPHLATRKAVRNRVQQLRESLSAELLARWFDCGPQLQPSHRLALLAGHPRSGTTLLEQVLDSHPDIVSAEETEILHNDVYIPLARLLPPDAPMLSILESPSVDMLQQVRGNYFRAMRSSLGTEIGGRLLIDKNPSYTLTLPTLIRVFPEIKFLIALRDPRDVCLSAFMQVLEINPTTVAFLSLATTVEEYATVMGMWTTVAPLMKNPYLEVRYEDMVDNLESVSRRVLEFLGVAWDDKVLRFDEHARQKAVRSPTYADVTKPVFKTAVGRWRNYQKYLEPYLQTLAPFAEHFGYA